jgi:murein DD-endopeptidase MepM/ murein hydrolase activator NlpD
VAIIGLIFAAVAGTVALTPVPGGKASGQVQRPPAEKQPATAQVSQASAERQSIEPALQPSVPLSDSLLLAVLSLEASTTSSEVEASMRRIMDLGMPHTALTPVKLNEPGTELDNANSVEDLESPADSATPAVEEPVCRETGNAAYCVYTVVEGDTLGAIAEAAGFSGNDSLSAAEMLAQSNKPDVVSSDHIEPGQNIRVPREPGILHTVFADETAGQLAEEYGASVEDILDSPYNSVGGDGVLLTGQEVFIPNPTRLPVNEEVEIAIEDPETPAEAVPTSETAPEPASEPPTPEPSEEPTIEPTATPGLQLPPIIPPLGPLDTPTPTPEPTQEPTATPTPETEEETEQDEDATPEPAPRRPPGDSFFIWPVVGPVSSYFGPSHPLGIDIDLYDDPNAEIVAARGGTVVFAGGDSCCSYGLYVIVEHENGIRTLYAHLSRISVSEGDEVAQGERLGRAGRTGYATGNHLHFEIRVNGDPVDPLKYLP